MNKSDLQFFLDCVQESDSNKEYIKVDFDVGFSEVVFCKESEEVFVLDIDFDGNVIADLKAKTIWHYLMINLLLVYPWLFDELMGATSEKN